MAALGPSRVQVRTRSREWPFSYSAFPGEPRQRGLVSSVSPQSVSEERKRPLLPASPLLGLTLGRYREGSAPRSHSQAASPEREGPLGVRLHEKGKPSGKGGGIGSIRTDALLTGSASDPRVWGSPHSLIPLINRKQ